MIVHHSLSIQQLLAYASAHHNTYCYLNGNSIQYPYNAFPHLIGMGVQAEYLASTDEDFSWEEMDDFIKKHKGEYILSCVNYGLKNHIESFDTCLHDDLEFPVVHLFVPQYIFIQGSDSAWTAQNKDSELLIPKILAHKSPSVSQPIHRASSSTAQYSRLEYLAIIHRIKNELAKGNIYEINFCNSYNGTYENLDYTLLYEQLNEISPMPFSALYKTNDHVIVSASPERFIKKSDNRLISQPIKGTAGRMADLDKDTLQKTQLEKSLKERTENIMIVDLVRNDLSKICQGGTVRVEELCKVYTFEKVHQMISTIAGELQQNDISFSEILQALFPMGSMTGAPKLKAMQLIDELEHVARGLFSGTVGYFSPNGNFDFNVIIRSILFNEKKKLYKFHAGSAITMASDAEQEYKECDVKTLPIRLLLQDYIQDKSTH